MLAEVLSKGLHTSMRKPRAAVQSSAIAPRSDQHFPSFMRISLRSERCRVPLRLWPADFRRLRKGGW